MCAFNLPPDFAVLPLAKRESFSKFYYNSSSLSRGGGPLAVEEMAFACSISLPALPYSLLAKRESFLDVFLFKSDFYGF